MQGGFVGEPSDTTASQIPPMAEDAEGDNDSKAEESQTAAPFNLDGVIEQTVLLDDDALTIEMIWPTLRFRSPTTRKGNSTS